MRIISNRSLLAPCNTSTFFTIAKWCLVLTILSSGFGCAGKPDALEMRQELYTGKVDELTQNLEKHHKQGQDLNLALNLGRTYQLLGQWEESIKAFAEASLIIDEYENRALVNIREMSSSVGMFALARGSKGYFGAGYERGLLHTLNSINYLMLGDLEAAAVELRKMEKRQEFWLAESSERILKASQDNVPIASPSELPAGYSLQETLSSAAISETFSSYQEPFSYALSAGVHAITENMDYAQVSYSRAAQLLENQYGEEFKNKFDLKNAVPKSQILGKPEQSALPENSEQYAQIENDEISLMIIALTGLAPSLHMETFRYFMPAVGYIMVDLPAYQPTVYSEGFSLEVYIDSKKIESLALLDSGTLAYRHLWDELKYETGSAMSRAAVRAGIAGGVYAVAANNEDTEAIAWLAGLATTVTLDIVASFMNDEVRNWDTLPAKGFLGLAKVPAGEQLTISIDGYSKTITLPTTGNGVIVLISHLPNNYARIDYVQY